LVFAFDRAREWTDALSTWCGEQPQLPTFAGRCLVYRAEILQLGGAWKESAEEAERAYERVRLTNDARCAADAAYQRAEIQRLRGDFHNAEASYRLASQGGREPQPGLALLRLAQGQVAAAGNAIRPALQSANDRLQRTRYLPAHVEIMLAAGEVEEADASARELAEIAEAFGTAILGAVATAASGAVHLARGEAHLAVGPLRSAFEIWQKAGAPYIAARIRTQIALACLALGDQEGASLEFAAAREVFHRLGAAPDLGRLTTLETRDAPRHPLTARELQVVREVASGKTNRAIAQDLGLSEKTIDRHLSNVFIKVGVPSRTALTAWAYEQKLI
jgi:DNA-binding CsgD family transcriptional regulator